MVLFWARDKQGLKENLCHEEIRKKKISSGAIKIDKCVSPYNNRIMEERSDVRCHSKDEEAINGSVY